MGLSLPFTVLQAMALCSGLQSRSSGDLGVSPLMFLRLLSGHVYAACLVGQNRWAVTASPLLVACVALAGSLLLLYAVAHGPSEISFFIVYVLLLFAAALVSPLIVGPLPKWDLLAHDRGARYCFCRPLLLPGPWDGVQSRRSTDLCDTLPSPHSSP